MARNYATDTIWAGRKNQGNKPQPLYMRQMAAKQKLVSLKGITTKKGKPMWFANLEDTSIKVCLFNVSNIAKHAGITIGEGDSPVFEKPIWVDIGGYDSQYKNFSQLEICDELYQESTEPKERPAPKDAKWHGETVTVFLARNKNRGGRDIWELQAMDAFNERIHFTAWPEHNRTIIAAGFDSLPAYGALGVQAVKFDVVLEAIDALKGQYRISHVYKADGTLVSVDETTKAYAESRRKKTAPIAVVAKPVTIVIPVTVELTLEEELRVYYQDDSKGYADYQAIIRKHIGKPTRPLFISESEETESENAA